MKERKLERHTHPDNTTIHENDACIINFTGHNHIKDSKLFMKAIKKSSEQNNLETIIEERIKEIDAELPKFGYSVEYKFTMQQEQESLQKMLKKYRKEK